MLKGSTSSGQSFGFQLSAAQSHVAGLVADERVRVHYKQLVSGTLITTAITYPGSISATGTVVAIASDGSAFTVHTPNGATVTVVTAGAPQLLDGVQPGDTVRVGYSKVGSELIGHTIVVRPTPLTSGSGGSPPTPGAP